MTLKYQMLLTNCQTRPTHSTDFSLFVDKLQCACAHIRYPVIRFEAKRVSCSPFELIAQHWMKLYEFCALIEELMEIRIRKNFLFSGLIRALRKQETRAIRNFFILKCYQIQRMTKWPVKPISHLY